MKKFLAYLMVIVITVSLGFAVFYLVRDNEKIALTTTTLYRDKGSTFELALDMSKNNSYTKITVSSSNEDVVSITSREIDVKKGVAKATLVANDGGMVRVNFQTNNSKFRNLYCDITIGDGSKENPYHIENASQFALIGKDEKYTLSSCYEIVSDLNLSLEDDKWTPIGNETKPFTGSISGNGHTIYNAVVSNVGKNIGIFSNIGAGAKIDNLQFKNITVESSDSTETMGVVAGINNGTITRVEVVDSIIANNNSDTYVGGIVGKNLSYFSPVAPVNASIVRASVNAKFVGKVDETLDTAITGKIGGIAGQNNGGTIAYTYTKSPNTVVLSSNTSVFGGIVGENKYVENPGTIEKYSKDLKAFVRDSYTILNVDTTSPSTSALIGAVVGENSEASQQIYGCYYAEGYIEVSGIGSTTLTEKYIVEAMSVADMKSLSNYVSHIEQIPYYDYSAGGTQYTDGDTIYWSKNIWSVLNDTNEGFPVLNMTAMDVNTAIVSNSYEAVSSINELWDKINENLDAECVISTMDTTGFEWIPIGTKEKPFKGSIVGGNQETGEEYSIISNLTIKQHLDTNYAGMFGYVSGEANILNIKLQNVKVASDDIDIAGGLVAINYGTIKNCVVENGLITANTYVGGLVGQNYGSIVDNSSVSSASDSTSQGLAITSKSQKEQYVGGIAGYNEGTIEKVSVKNNVVLQCADNAQYVQVGGAVGANKGNIETANVSLNSNINLKNASGCVGGVAGYSDGNIENTSVNVNIIASKDENTYVGGVVGIFVAKISNNESTHITYANVENSTLEGKYVGGIVSTLNTEYSQKYNISDNWFRNFVSEQYQVDSKVYNKDLMYAVHATAVKDDVTLKGKYTGGIAYNIINGVVLDAYSQANLAGSNNAGIVYYINFNGKEVTGGLMSRVYAVVKFDAGSKNYSVTASNVHSDGWNLSKRTAGFIDDYYYTVAKDKGSKDPTYSGGIIIDVGNWFTNDENRISKRDRSQSTMKGTDLWTSFTTDSAVTGDTVWITGNGYPTIKDL